MVDGDAVPTLGCAGAGGSSAQPRQCSTCSTRRRPSNPPRSPTEQVTSDAAKVTPDELVTRFTDCAEILRTTTMSKETVITYPVVGSTTLAVVAEVALMEATVHLLDLADAVGGVQPSEIALAATRDLLIAVPAIR
jgi:hypothetical protein